MDSTQLTESEWETQRVRGWADWERENAPTCGTYNKAIQGNHLQREPQTSEAFEVRLLNAANHSRCATSCKLVAKDEINPNATLTHIRTYVHTYVYSVHININMYVCKYVRQPEPEPCHQQRPRTPTQRKEIKMKTF